MMRDLLKNISPLGNPVSHSPRGWIRWKALLLISFGIIAGLVYLKYFFDNHLKTIIESRLSLLNGRKVEISRLRSRLLNPYIELKGIQITHPRYPDKNLFSIEHLSINLSFLPLLRKKLIVTDFTLSNVSYFTNRETAGELAASDGFSSLASLIEGTGSKSYEGIRKQFSESPLPLLNKLKMGWNLRAKVSTLRKRLSSLSRLQALSPEFDEMKSNWAKNLSERKDLKKISSEWKAIDRLPASTIISEREKFLDTVTRQIEELANQIYSLETQIKKSDAELNYIYSLVDQDIPAIRKEVQLPHLDVGDISPYLFGPHLFALLERAGFWVEWSREMLPTGSSKTSLQKRSRGLSFHFANKDYSPLFLLVRSQFSSDCSDLPGGGTIKGTIEGLTSDPSLYQLPFRFHMTADFPSRGVRGLDFSMVVDHTKEIPEESFSLKLQEFPIDNFLLSSVSGFRFKLPEAKLSLSASAKLEGEKVQASGQAQFTQASFDLKTGEREVDDQILSEISHLKSFSVAGSMSGNLSEAPLGVESQLGRHLAQGLRNAHRNTFSVVDEAIRAEILNETDTMSYHLKEIIDSLRDNTLPQLHSELKLLTEFKKSADKELTRLSSISERTTRKKHSNDRRDRTGRLPSSRSGQ